MKVTIEKRTGTYADTLHAVGVGSLLEELGFTSARLRDANGVFEAEGTGEAEPSAWPPVSPGYPYIWEPSKEGAPKKGVPQSKPLFSKVLDYEAAKQQNERWKVYRNSLGKSKGKAAATSTTDAPDPPPPDYFVAAMLASMRSGWNGDRSLARWIEQHPAETAAWVSAALTGTPLPNEIPDISNSQIFNPAGGKGIHSSKSVLKSSGSLPDVLVDPFVEWMKFRGLWEAMLLYRSGDDFKFFVLEPADIALHHLREIRTELVKLELWGGMRLDIRATLECLRTLLLRSQAFESGGISIFGRSPRRVMAGLRLAYFKSLGSGSALMNESLFPLPDWFAVQTRADAEAYLLVIEETIGKTADSKDRGCLGWLAEDHSDEGATLQQYRDWLLTGELPDILEFHARLAVHIMQRRSRQEYVREFSTTVLDILFGRAFPKEPCVKEIIDSSGFSSVSRAVRDSTIYADLKNRPVHFGLAQKWKQKAKAGPAEFMTAVAEFVQEQNWEVQHRLKGRGHMVSTADMDELVRLVDAHGAELVGSLLLAYGYARPPKVDKEQAEQETAQ